MAAELRRLGRPRACRGSRLDLALHKYLNSKNINYSRFGFCLHWFNARFLWKKIVTANSRSGTAAGGIGRLYLGFLGRNSGYESR